jgi:hypothetical protein
VFITADGRSLDETLLAAVGVTDADRLVDRGAGRRSLTSTGLPSRRRARWTPEKVEVRKWWGLADGI